VYTVGFLIKPQAVAALPIFVFWGLRDEIRQVLPVLSGAGEPLARAGEFARVLAARIWPVAAAALAVAFLIVFPFFPSNPLGIFDQLIDATNVENYKVTSFFAYNFWGMVGMFEPDGTTFWGLAYRWWGILLYLGAMVGIIWTFRDAKSPGLLALGTALSVLAFYLFLTRMHERYLFSSILLLVTAGAALNVRSLWAASLWGVFGVLSVVQFLNVYFVYINFTSPPFADEDNYLRVGWLFDLIRDEVFLISLITFLTFPVLLVTGRFLAMREMADGEATGDG
jgi:Gpi18-like mannosyltransferase